MEEFNKRPVEPSKAERQLAHAKMKDMTSALSPLSIIMQNGGRMRRAFLIERLVERGCERSNAQNYFRFLEANGFIIKTYTSPITYEVALEYRDKVFIPNEKGAKEEIKVLSSSAKEELMDDFLETAAYFLDELVKAGFKVKSNGS